MPDPATPTSATASRSVRLEVDTNASALMAALIAIESQDARGVFDEEQHAELTSLVLGMREAVSRVSDP